MACEEGKLDLQMVRGLVSALRASEDRYHTERLYRVAVGEREYALYERMALEVTGRDAGVPETETSVAALSRLGGRKAGPG